MSIAGKVGAVFLQTEDAPVPFIKEVAAPNAERTIYIINNEACRYLDKDSAAFVYVNDVVQNSGFTIQYLGGSVIFADPLEEDDKVTVSGKSITVDQAGGFFSWNIDLSSDNADATTFESEGWKENLPTIKGFSASADSYWADEQLSERVGREVIAAFYLDTGASKKRYEGFAVISSDSIELSVDDVINESIEFEGVGKLCYREG